MHISDWALFLTQFLTLSALPVLQDKGKISSEMARLKAESLQRFVCGKTLNASQTASAW